MRRALAEKQIRKERQQAAEALRQSEEQYRSVTQMAPDAIITIDAAGRIVTWNYGAQRIFQYTEAEALGQLLTTLMP